MKCQHHLGLANPLSSASSNMPSPDAEGQSVLQDLKSPSVFFTLGLNSKTLFFFLLFRRLLLFPIKFLINSAHQREEKHVIFCKEEKKLII